MSNETRTTDADLDLIGIAAEIVCAYVANNPVPPGELPGLILSAHRTLYMIATPKGTVADVVESEKPTPAQIKKSITPGGLISFVDGKSYKTLKRHLTKNGLDPHSYRAKFGLPADYPTTCADYSAARSNLAKSLGLGQPGRAARTAAPAIKKAA